MPKSYWVFRWSAWIAMVALGCASQEGQRSDALTDTDGSAGAGAPAVTWAAIYERVMVPSGCVRCHGKAAELDLSLEKGHANLLGVAAKGGKCAPTGMLRVDVGHPKASLLLDKLSDTPICGTRMPTGEQASEVSAEQIELVRTWIAEGAQE